jgi:hypothetical protein
MVYNIQIYWVFGLCASSGTLKTREHNVSKTGCLYPFKPNLLLYVSLALGLILKSSALCPCFALFSKYTAIIFVHSINRTVFIHDMQCLCAAGTEFLNITLMNSVLHRVN